MKLFYIPDRVKKRVECSRQILSEWIDRQRAMRSLNLDDRYTSGRKRLPTEVAIRVQVEDFAKM